jgi:hypothetical protein
MFGVLFAIILCNLLVVSVYATSVVVETSITQDFHAVFTFSDINATVYGNITSKGLMTEDTVPTALYDNMARKGHFGVDYNSQSISFDNNTHTIVSAFNLTGSSIVNSTIDRAAKIETFQMNTAWRKFYLNITDFQFNFTQDFTQPLSNWTNSTTGGVTSYSYSNSTTGVSFSFRLPSYASNIAVIGDTITFNTPYEPSFLDNLIDSPILILIALAVAGVLVYFYRKIK